MNIRCGLCKKKNKGFYSTFLLESSYVTWCNDCRYGKGISKQAISNDEMFNKLQTPFWKLMGQKPKPKDVAYEKYLKHKNMTYGDAVRLRNLNASNPSRLPELQKHLNAGGK